jgi:hypothetical protein
LARLEGKFEADAGGALDDRDLLALVSEGSSTSLRRSELVARYLCAGVGWREAAVILGGAFGIAAIADRTGLNGGKEQ